MEPKACSGNKTLSGRFGRSLFGHSANKLEGESAVFAELRAYAVHRTAKRAAHERVEAKHRMSVTTRALAALR
eukprot:scaffold262752_cov21-Tisochrysis_lutea.AAC.1